MPSCNRDRSWSFCSSIQLFGNQPGLTLTLLRRARATNELNGFGQDLADQPRQIAAPTGQHMDMAMRNGLMSGPPFVDSEVDAIRGKLAASQGLGDAVGRFQEVCPQGRGQVRKIFTMGLGHHQHMARSQREGIHQGQADITLA